MKKILLAMVLVIAFGASSTFAYPGHSNKGNHNEASKKAPYTEVTAEELQTLLKNDKSAILIDSRCDKSLNGEIIEGAINLSTKKIDAESLAKIIPSKNTVIAFYCSNKACSASALAAYKAAHAGYTKIYKYPGGIDDWKEKGLPITKK